MWDVLIVRLSVSIHDEMWCFKMHCRLDLFPFILSRKIWQKLRNFTSRHHQLTLSPHHPCQSQLSVVHFHDILFFCVLGNSIPKPASQSHPPASSKHDLHFLSLIYSFICSFPLMLVSHYSGPSYVKDVLTSMNESLHYFVYCSKLFSSLRALEHNGYDICSKYPQFYSFTLLRWFPYTPQLGPFAFFGRLHPQLT